MKTCRICDQEKETKEFGYLFCMECIKKIESYNLYEGYKNIQRGDKIFVDVFLGCMFKIFFETEKLKDDVKKLLEELLR